ncbi:MAG: SpoIIE family protein phosphatase [Actinomycetota bacterium]|nr:SpoIIE family protein phosphatase [Actinomycetota bacterium]
MAADLARRAGLTLDNARLYEDQLSTSRTLQRGLLPPELPDVPCAEVGVVYQPSGRSIEVGGDFYDVFPLGDDRWGFAIGDVCGKGAEAAAVTGLARHALRLLVREGLALPVVLERLNAAILEEGERARFLTVVLGTIRPRPGGGACLTMVSAGHPLPLRLRAGGGVDFLGTPSRCSGFSRRCATRRTRRSSTRVTSWSG